MSECLLVEGDTYCSFDWIALQIYRESKKDHFKSKVHPLMLDLHIKMNDRDRIMEELNKTNSCVSAAIIDILIEWQLAAPNDAKLSEFIRILKQHSLNSYAKVIEDKLGSAIPRPSGHQEIHKHVDECSLFIKTEQEGNNYTNTVETDKLQSEESDDSYFTSKNSNAATKTDYIRYSLLNETYKRQNNKAREQEAIKFYMFILFVAVLIVMSWMLVGFRANHVSDKISNSTSNCNLSMVNHKNAGC